MVKGAILRQGRQLLFVALTVALGISLATAMLNVMFDVGEKVNQELKAFGANITVTSKNSSILKDIYGLDDESAPKEYLKEHCRPFSPSERPCHVGQRCICSCFRHMV